MTIKHLKKSNGFAASDALIAILIITLFTGIIASLLYNIYLSNASLKRMSKANAYIVDMFEYIDKIYYDEVSQDNLISYFNKKYYYADDGITPKENLEVMAAHEETLINTPFKVIISIQKYNQTEENKNKLDLVKEISMIVKYKLGNKEQEIALKRVKLREKLVGINKPDIDLLTIQEGQKVYSIKETNNSYIICYENDINWYNYENEKFAKVLVTNKDLEIGYQLTDEDALIYKWIPRYAKDSEGNKQYLYSNTNKYVAEQNGYQKLIDLEDEDGYTVDSNYFREFTGVWEEI